MKLSHAHRQKLCLSTTSMHNRETSGQNDRQEEWDHVFCSSQAAAGGKEETRF